MTYHELYGDVSVAQLRAYKRYNVSPADHDALVNIIGATHHNDIVAAVKRHSPKGYFSAYSFYEEVAMD